MKIVGPSKPQESLSVIIYETVRHEPVQPHFFVVWVIEDNTKSLFVSLRKLKQLSYGCVKSSEGWKVSNSTFETVRHEPVRRAEPIDPALNRFTPRFQVK